MALDGTKSLWEHDYDAINDAIRKLEIWYPVHIERTFDGPPWLGRYVGMLADPAHGLIHEIEVGGWLKPEKASAVIWHELAHAKQCEKYGGMHAYEAVYASQVERLGLEYARFGDVGYAREHSATIERVPLEQEANTIERDNTTTLLTRPTQ